MELQTIRFGPYELHAASRELYKFGTKVKLRPQPFQVLSLLLRRAGDVVTREQLRQQLWPSDTFVDFEHSLNTAIKELRGVLNDSATDSRFIETLPKLGYRFIFPVENGTPAGQSIAIAVAVELEATRAAGPGRTRPSDCYSSGAKMDLALPRRRRGPAFRNSYGRRTDGGFPTFRKRSRFRSSQTPSLDCRPWLQEPVTQPDDEWMSAAMAEMLGAELASGQQIRVIPSENIARMKLDLSLAPTDTYGQDTLGKIHNHLGTDMIASGSYLALADGSSTKLRIVLQVQDTHTGETIAAITEDGAESDLPQLISAGGDNLRRTLGIGSLSAAATHEVRASVPANSEAERLYAEGLEKLQGFDALAARGLLEKAIAADPNHALSHSALADSPISATISTPRPKQRRLSISPRISRVRITSPSKAAIVSSLMTVTAPRTRIALFMISSPTISTMACVLHAPKFSQSRRGRAQHYRRPPKTSRTDGLRSSHRPRGIRGG